jgi:hypothetical protein
LQAVSVPSPNTRKGLPRFTRSTCPDSDFEERGRPDDRVGQAGSGQRRLERQLGVLERQQRLLHADGREQDEVADAGVPRRRERVDVHPVVDGPGVPGGAGARGHAGHDGVERFAAEPVAGDGGGIAHLDDADPGALQGPRAGRPGADEAHHVMPAPHQRAQRRATDGAGGARRQTRTGGRLGGDEWRSCLSPGSIPWGRFRHPHACSAPSSRDIKGPVRSIFRFQGRPPTR